MFVDILGVFVHVYLYMHVHTCKSAYICRRADVPMYVGVGRLYM